MALDRRFSALTLLMLSINGMVGSAWLFAPLYAAKIAGSASIIAWLLGGLITVIIALTFAELSVMFPVAGGTAQIPQLSHGTLTSFMISWLAWLSSLTMAPIEVQAILQYASTYFTSLIHMQNGVPVLSGIGFIWATVLMLSFCFINIASYRGLVRFNFLLFTFKVIVIVIAVWAITFTSFHTANFAGLASTATSLTGWHAILAAVATGGIAFAFTGFKHGVELAGEAKNVALTIPVAIIGSVVACLLLYLGLQFAFIGALNPSDVANGWSHLTFAGEVGPFAGLAAGLGLVWLLNLLYIDAVISPSGAGLIYVTSTARILYAMSQIGYMPQWLLKLNKQHFPVAAILTNFVIGMFLFLPLPGWQAMVSFLVSGMVLSYAMGPISLICMRYELPEHVRRFKLPCAQVICPLAFYFCNLLNYWTGWHTISKLAIAMAIGAVIFVVAIIRGQLKGMKLGLTSALWLVPYLVGLVVISYLGAFDGNNMIPFGWDFVVIGIFSLVIFYLAVYDRATVTDKFELDQRMAEISTF